MRSALVPLTLAASLAIPSGATAQFTASGLLEIHTIDIGQASSTLVIGPNGKMVLLEAGKADETIHDYLTGLGMTPGDLGDRLDYTLVGHMHVDHFRGFKNLFEPPDYWPGSRLGFEVSPGGKNWYNGSPKFDEEVTDSTTNTYAYAHAAERTDGGYPEAVGMDWQLSLGDGAWLRVVAVNGHVYDDDEPAEYIPPKEHDWEDGYENDRSVAVLVHYGDFDYLWASDLTGGSDACTGRTNGDNDVETPLARGLTPEPDATPETAFPLLSELGVDVLHVNHHGSETSTNSFYIGRLKPEVAVISVGSNATYKHPRKTVVEDVLMAPASICKPAPPALVLQTAEGPDDPVTSHDGYCVGDIWVMTDGTFYGVGAGGAGADDERDQAGLPAFFVADELAPDCPMEVTLSELRIDSLWEWRAKHKIETENSVRLVTGADVLLQAGAIVELGDGLVVEEGARLNVGIEPFTDCTPPTP